MQAITLEAIATFFLVFVVFGTCVNPEAPKVGGFAVGLTIAADIIAIGPLTGASMNPARSFGPAVAAGVYEGQIVFWLGPLIESSRLTPAGEGHERAAAGLDPFRRSL
jgi:glycerol uptake facilitator-like aquaporin